MILAAAIAGPAQTFKTLQRFDSKDGSQPFATLVHATDGNLYGTTCCGGTGGGSGGTIFRMSQTGALTTVYDFCSQAMCTDGEYPTAPLVLGTDGNLYGTTSYGGANLYYGTVFKVTLGGALTTLYNFCAQSGCADGASPQAGLVPGVDGNFYGTTLEGGRIDGLTCPNGCGTIFRITRSGTRTTLYNFCSQSNCTDGYYPYAGLVQGADGNLYGTASGGGAGNVGTVFKITTSGTLTTLHSFCSELSCADGSQPKAALVQGSDGNFYGTTYTGGSYGTVFKITPGGTLTTLHSFEAGGDGGGPVAALVQGTDGNFYGTTYAFGANGPFGTVFKVTPTGTLTTLYNFCSESGCPDGSNPIAGLVQDTIGTFYGTTPVGASSHNIGTVFSLSVGLRPFVEAVPITGKAGRSVTILGTKLTGTTSVTFNGIAAAFTVQSGTAIKATVPTGATTGPVEVVTPSGTLTSNGNFRVE